MIDKQQSQPKSEQEEDINWDDYLDEEEEERETED